MNLSDTIVPRSDQLNAEDLLTGPRTVTITEVRKGSTEQPVEIVTAEFGTGRPFKPSKTVRRILVAAWGVEASVYVGRRLTIYRDPAVRFGGQNVGGIRVSAMSHIDKPLTISLTETRGKRTPWTVQPLADDDPPSKPPSSKAQWQRINALFAVLGIDDKDAKLADTSARIGREVHSSTDLTGDELTRLIESLERSAGAP